jgi:hypothetical protein
VRSPEVEVEEGITSSDQEELQLATSSEPDVPPVAGTEPAGPAAGSPLSGSDAASSPESEGVGYSDIDWDEEQWLLEHGTVPDCDAYPDDADFLTMDQIDLLDRHE